MSRAEREFQALSSKHASIRGAVDKGRADLHATHEQVQIGRPKRQGRNNA